MSLLFPVLSGRGQYSITSDSYVQDSMCGSAAQCNLCTSQRPSTSRAGEAAAKRCQHRDVQLHPVHKLPLMLSIWHVNRLGNVLCQSEQRTGCIEYRLTPMQRGLEVLVLLSATGAPRRSGCAAPCTWIANSKVCFVDLSGSRLGPALMYC